MLDAIDELTKPVTLHVEQETETGVGPVRTIHPPLLTQLENAISSSTGGRANGGNPSTRSVLNSDALYRFMLITTTIRSWCLTIQVRPGKDAGANLRAWYVARLARPAQHDEFYVREMHRWAAEIRAQLDPLGRFEITDPCVECGSPTYVDAEGVTRNRPVLVTYMVGDVEATTKAECRSCGYEWAGEFGMRVLKDKVAPEEKETA